MDIFSFYRSIRPLVIVVLMVISFAAGYGIHFVPVPSRPPHAQIRLDRYRYISPLLDCEITQHSSTKRHPDLRPLGEVVHQKAEAHLADRSAHSISVYFRELTSGLTFGRNEQQMIAPASLMKVPLMIAILKRAELDPALLEKKMRYDARKAPDQSQHFKPKKILQHGASYTVDDLLFRMIAYSDNNSMMLLSDHFGMAVVDDALSELNVPVDTSGRMDRISLRNYTAFFRILFNASYLTHAMSEKALDYLVSSSFQEGIRSGVPRGIPVANKFGESYPGEYNLHEFAIVYYPDHPYLIGVATMGGSPESLAHVIGEISQAVYQEMDRQHRKAS